MGAVCVCYGWLAGDHADRLINQHTTTARAATAAAAAAVAAYHTVMILIPMVRQHLSDLITPPITRAARFYSIRHVDIPIQ